MDHSPPPHEVNLWGGHGEGLTLGRQTWLDLARGQMATGPAAPAAARAGAGHARGVAAGFTIVGSVAVLEGDELTTTPSGTGFGLNKDNLAQISSRFIAAFGDEYDQIAVFLGFTDRLSQQALAYQQPVKNDIRGLGLGFWDETRQFGSPSGRMESMLNMKRINVYGRDAANDPDNDLYSVWAQEAAHRWALYFKYRFPDDAADRTDLLLRQNAHWAPWVQSEGSFLDGLNWKDNGDGTFTVLDANNRYGTADQYAMGLRSASEVPAFFLLDEFRDETGGSIDRNARFSPGRRYTAKRTNVTIEDIVRALGPREPARSPAAEDLRMGVVFLTPPGSGLGLSLGEAFRVETTRAPWDGFYNASAGGRGKVCTELLRPCRGQAFTFGAPTLAAAGRPAGVVAPGDEVQVTLPVTNVGTEPGVATVSARGEDITFSPSPVSTPPLAPGQATVVSFTAQLPATLVCGAPHKIDFEAPGRLGPSKGFYDVSLGLARGPGFDLEDAGTPAAWTVNPDGTDTARVGAWEWGTPERTEAFQFVLQPGGAVSGTRAFVTGAAAGPRPEANDLDFDTTAPQVGRTTLESPPMPLAGLGNPRLSYQLHFVAAGFEREVLVPGAGDGFYVQASFDGGPWVEVDRVPATLALGWESRLAPLAPAWALAPAAISVRFRFVAEDSDLSETVVEAALDDVFLMGELPACGAPAPGVPPEVKPNDGGGCSFAGPRGGADAPWSLAALALLLARARRFTRRA